MRRQFRVVAAVVLAVAVWSCVTVCVDAKIERLAVRRDGRRIFAVETFGFDKGGQFTLTVGGMSAALPKRDKTLVAGFVLMKVYSTEDVVGISESYTITGQCLFDNLQPSHHAVVLNTSDNSNWARQSVSRTIDTPGLYALFFTACRPDGARMSYALEASFKNPGGYLSSGLQPLPELYAFFTVVFGAAFLVWLHILRKAGRIHHVHHMMTVLLVLKLCSLLFEGIMYHFIRARGHTVGFNVVYYIFTFAKGTMLFVVILLIGTGWSLLKPFLAPREKKVLMVVLPLQILDNIAYVVLFEMTPGSSAFTWWNVVMHMVDMVCCAAVIVPIVWSVHHLRQAAGTDGKTQDTLNRLTQFRQYYLAVLGFVYFTRFVVYIADAVLPYTMAWMSVFATEAATLMFYCVIGYKFRPAAKHPYLRVEMQDLDGDVEAGAGAGSGGLDAGAEGKRAE